MGCADEDLRHGAPAARALEHFDTPLRFPVNLELGEIDALALQKRFRLLTIGAPSLRIDRHFAHSRASTFRQLETQTPHVVAKASCTTPSCTTLAKTRTSTASAPPRKSARAAALAVAPVVSTSSTRSTRSPVTLALASSATSKAPDRLD